MYNTYMPYQYPQRQEFRQPAMAQPIIPQPNAGFNCTFVASKAEVDATPTPVDGSTAAFRDVVNDKFYTKAFNLNSGTVSVATYGREADVVPVPAQYATVEVVDEIKQSINRLAGELERIKKGGTTNDTV